MGGSESGEEGAERITVAAAAAVVVVVRNLGCMFPPRFADPGIYRK